MDFKESTVIHGDCQDVLKQFSEESVDFIMTSPPYADQRKSTYGGVKPDDYVNWFMPIAQEMYRVLKGDGSLIINIKEKVVDGERHTYVLELIIAMKEMGWLWTDEYIWHKKNAFPGKWNNRFRDAWERCLHFTKNKKFNMYQEAVMIPMGDWKDKRLKNLCKNDINRDKTNGVGNTLTTKQSNWVGREMCYPSNVLYMSTSSTNRNHPATFPHELPEWFIKLFSKEGDVVLDPFLGSGTTAQVSIKLKRLAIGIEKMEEYLPTICENLKFEKSNQSNITFDLYQSSFYSIF